MSTDFVTKGYHWARQALSPAELLRLANWVDENHGGAGTRHVRLDGIKDLLAPTGTVGAFADKLLPSGRPVRVTVFNKSNDQNWLVPWHQDRVIAVRDRHDLVGFSAWTKQDDYWHCEPPIEAFKKSVFIRIHLDELTTENGAMQIAAASHLNGFVPAGSAREVAEECEIDTGECKAGDLLACNSLILHRSEKSKTNARRRTIRIDYSAFDLPEPLEWAIEQE